MKRSNRVSVNKAFQTGTVPTEKRKLMRIMLDKKHCNRNGCCIHVLTQVTQREALACHDHEKYCQIECPSTCPPKFDIMVSILLILCSWYLSVCMETRQKSHIHTVDGPLPNTCRLVPWQQGYKMPNSFSVHLESCLLSFHIYRLLITKWNCLVQMLNVCVPHFFSWTMRNINAKIKDNDLRKQTKRSWQSC